jgi:hypothetical protein
MFGKSLNHPVAQSGDLLYVVFVPADSDFRFALFVFFAFIIACPTASSTTLPVTPFSQLF